MDMQLKISKPNLLKELNFIQGVVEKKNTIPILSSLLLEAVDGSLNIKGTDLDVSISTSCEAEVVGNGAVCVQAKKLFEIIRALPEAEIEIKCGESEQVSIVCERSRFKMLGQPKLNFPEIPVFKNTVAHLPADIFRTFITRTIFAATNEESRYALNGAKFELSPEGLRMVATDGHRLSFIEKSGTFTEDLKVEAIIPKKTLTELIKLSSETEETSEFGKDENHLFFKFGKRLLVSRMLNGQFPNYEMVLPKENKNHIVIESQRLAAAVRRVALMADERSRAIKFEISEGQLNITAQASDIGEAGETLPIEYVGDSITSGFNAQYVNDFFGVINDGDVKFSFKDGNSQVQLQSLADSDFDFRYVIMPMRL
jgi:DNA polymerase III subunit beta